MILSIFLSYLAGLITVLAPCILPLLPVIIGGSLSGDKRDKWRPYIIISSLLVSLLLFTLLLKASTVFIDIDPNLWTLFSGLLLIILGIFMLLPNLWARIIAWLGLENKSQNLLGKASSSKNKIFSAILIGAALGPVFSSCSPTYIWVIATVIPENSILGFIYLLAYCLGVASSLLAIALLGRKFIAKIKWASNPNGWFQRSIAILFIIVGVFVASGLDRQVQSYLVEKDFLNLTQLEIRLLPQE